MTPEQIQEAKDAISSSLNRLEDCALQLSATGQADVAFVLRSNVSILKHTATIALQRYEALVAENAKLLEKAEKLVGALRKIAVYDMYYCSSTEDTDFEAQAQHMYEIATEALAEWEGK